jgi:hypothetical protein
VLDDSPVCDCRRNVLVEIKQFCELGHADSWSLACEIGDGPLKRRTVDRIGPPYGMTGRAAESEERLVLIEIRRPSVFLEYSRQLALRQSPNEDDVILTFLLSNEPLRLTRSAARSIEPPEWIATLLDPIKVVKRACGVAHIDDAGLGEFTASTLCACHAVSSSAQRCCSAALSTLKIRSILKYALAATACCARDWE